MEQQETRVERAPAGNGSALPYQVRVNGELLRTKGGVARRFKTDAAAQKALDEAVGGEIYDLATLHGLTDIYADAHGSRRGEYVGTVNGKLFTCAVFDRDPVADLAAMKSAIETVETNETSNEYVSDNAQFGVGA